MVVLSDHDLAEAVIKQEIKIEPFNGKNLTPNGYDLSIDEVYIKKDDLHVSTGDAVIPPHCWFAVSTKEEVGLGPMFVAQLWIRSGYARKGVMASFGKVDAGFHGTLTISCFNASDDPLKLPVGDRFCQIVVEKLSSMPDALYEQRSGTWQHQKGITLER